MSTPLREGAGGYCLRSRVVPSSLNVDDKRSKFRNVAKPLEDAHAEERPYTESNLNVDDKRSKFRNVAKPLEDAHAEERPYTESNLDFDSRRSKLARWSEFTEAHAIVRPYAKVALKFYSERAQANYKLVEPGDMQSVGVVGGCIHHINFTAKKEDVADAPVQMFFAELTTTGIGIPRATICQCLGPEKNLSEAKTKINRCCFFCMDNNIYHPRCRGFKTGLENNGGIYF